MVKQTADRAVQSRSRTPQRPAACSVDNDQETYGFSTKVLIHGWQKRRMKVKPVACENITKITKGGN